MSISKEQAIEAIKTLKKNCLEGCKECEVGSWCEKALEEYGAPSPYRWEVPND